MDLFFVCSASFKSSDDIRPLNSPAKGSILASVPHAVSMASCRYMSLAFFFLTNYFSIILSGGRVMRLSVFLDLFRWLIGLELNRIKLLADWPLQMTSRYTGWIVRENVCVVRDIAVHFNISDINRLELKVSSLFAWCMCVKWWVMLSGCFFPATVLWCVEFRDIIPNSVHSGFHP